jgi:hypothetical protein
MAETLNRTKTEVRSFSGLGFDDYEIFFMSYRWSFFKNRRMGREEK